MTKAAIKTLLSSLLLTLFLSPIHAAITSASVTPISLNAGAASDVTVTFTSGVDVQVGGSVQISFPTGFQLDPVPTVAVATPGSSTTLSVVSASASRISVAVETSQLTANVQFQFSISQVTNPAAQSTASFSITTFDSSNNILETNTEVPGVTIMPTTLSTAAVAPDSLNAGVVGAATVSFTSAVRLPIGSVVKVTFPSDFSVLATATSSVSNIDSSSTVAMESTYVVAVTVAGSVVSSGAHVSFKLNGVTNPGAKTTGTFTVTTADSLSNIFQQSSAITGAAIVSTMLASATVTALNSIAGIDAIYTIVFETIVVVPKGGSVVLATPSDYSLSGAILLTDLLLSETWSGSIHGQTIVFSSPSDYAPGQHSVQAKYLQNPGASTTGSFTVSTTDPNGFRLETATCNGITIVPGSLSDAALTPHLAHAGIVSGVDITFTASAGLAKNSLLIVSLPPQDYAAAGTAISVEIKSPSGATGSATWDSMHTAIRVLLTSSNTIPHGAIVVLRVAALEMPPSIRAASPATIESWNVKGQQLDNVSTLALSAITAVQGLPCKWDTEIPHPGITSNALVTFTISGKVPVSGKIAFTIPTSDFMSTASDAIAPSVNFKFPSAIEATSAWNGTTGVLEVVLENSSIPANSTEIQVQIMSLETPISVRTASRQPASWATYDPLEILIDGPGTLQLDTITPGHIFGSRLWTAENPVAGATSDQTITFSISGKIDPGGSFEFILPDSQWTMRSSALATFESPSLGNVGLVEWNKPTRKMTVTLAGTIGIPAYASVKVIIPGVTNPPKETGINNGYLTTRAADGSIIDGSDTLSVLTVYRGALTGAKSWTSITTASASMLSDQLLSFTLCGALSSGSVIQVILPSGGWRIADGKSVMVSFSLPLSGIAVKAATWDSTTSELRITTDGDLVGGTPVELLVQSIVNPFAKANSDTCTVTTFLPDLGVVAESKDIAVNAIVSSELATEGSWISGIATPGVMSDQTITFTTGGRIEIGAKFFITIVDTWTLMPSTIASMVLEGSTQVSSLKYVLDARTNTLCATTVLGIDQETKVTIILTDVLSPESIRPERVGSILIRSHLGGDVNVGLIRFNAITKGALAGPLTWQSLFFKPGPVAGLKTSAILTMQTAGKIARGGKILVELPPEWNMVSSCKVTFVYPSVWGTAACIQNNLSILLLDGINGATWLKILVTGVINPPFVIPKGVASAVTIAPDGGEIDGTTNITTDAIVSDVIGALSSGDQLVAVVGVSKTFAFQGYFLATGDVIKFVDASTTSDANCGESTIGQSDVGGVSVKYLGDNQDVSLKFTQSSPDGQPFAICYKFGDNPFKLYSSLSITVKEITSVTADVGLSDVAVANFVKTWSFGGNGITTGDQIRWIDLDVVESVAFVLTPPDCLNPSMLAKLAPPASGVTAPEDEYTRVVHTATDATFAFSAESSGKTFCLCYKFGNEPYVVYPTLKVQVKKLRAIRATTAGSDDVAVVDAPKSFSFDGDGLFLNDRLYFVKVSSMTSCTASTVDTSLQLSHLIDGQIQSILFINADLTTQVNFDSTAAGQKVMPCYQFGMEPYQLYPDIQLTVKMVTHYTGALGSPQLAVADVPEPLIFLGYGLGSGDQVRWILRGQEDCQSSLASLTKPNSSALIDTITLDTNSAAIFNFTTTQTDFNPVLCYKFGVESFKLYSDISIAIGTIRGKSALTGAKDVAVVGARKNFTLSGTNLAQGDRVGWTTILDSVTPCANLSLLISNPSNLDSDYLSYLTDAKTFGVALASLNSGKRAYLCYGFGLEPFKLLHDLYVDVKSILNMRALVASPRVAVAGALKTFLFDGDGVATGDFAKFVPRDSGDCTYPGITLMNIMKEYDDYDEMAMYLYEVADTTTTGSFQIQIGSKSVGLARVLCYRFGVEPFAFYTDFTIDVKTIWTLRQVDTNASGQDNVMVAHEPKHMAIDGVGVSVKDALKFINATNSSEDADCRSLAAQGHSSQQINVSSDLTVLLPFDYGSQGGKWTLCYKFDDEPFRLYPSVTITVKEVTALLDYSFQNIAGLGGVATIGHLKQWKPVGSGIQVGDTVKIVPQSVMSSTDCGQNNASIAAGTSLMTVAGSDLTFSGTITTFPLSTSDLYHVCYQFQDEPFTYIRQFTLTTYGVVSLDRSVVLVSATTIAQVNGFRISDTDQLGWTTSSSSCSTAIGLTAVSGTKATIMFLESYSRLFLCYSFNRQPFNVFDTVTLSVVKADIWMPQTISIIADQPSEIVVLGTFGIAQGADKIAWVPSGVVECSSDAVTIYSKVMRTSIASAARTQTAVPHAGTATFKTEYVAPASGSGIAETESFSTWKLCYHFGTTPGYVMFGDVLCTVLNIIQVSLLDIQPSSTGAVMKFEFGGIGMQDFDSAKWVDSSVASIDSDCNRLPGIGGSNARDVVSSRATFTFVDESSAMALCYKFKGHAFKLYTNLPVLDATASEARLKQSTTGALSTGYDEEATAATSDQFTPNLDIATVSLTLDKDISEIPVGSSAELAFKTSFIETLANSLGIDSSRIQITEVVAGSVIVKFQLLPSHSVADPSVREAILDLQNQLRDGSSSFHGNGVFIVKNPAAALDFALTTPATPATSSMAIQALGYQPNGLFSFVKSIYSVTEKSANLVIPVIRLQGTASVVSLSVQIQTHETTAAYNDDFTLSTLTTFDSSLKLIHLRFEPGDELQTIEFNIVDNTVEGAHFKSISLALLDPQLVDAALGTMKQSTIRIYDYGDGIALAKSSFVPSSTDSNTPQVFLQGWQVEANGASRLRGDANGIFAVDDALGGAEYNQKCDLAAPTGGCAFTCEVGGGLPSTTRVESAYNVLDLNGGDYVASMNSVNSFPSLEFTVSLWVKTFQKDSGACLFSYAVSTPTGPAVPLSLCNPSNLQLFINAESNASGLVTFVNVSDNVWHFVAVTWSSESGRVRIFDNGMQAFDGGPYRVEKTIDSNGFFVVGHLVLSSATKAPCTVSAAFGSATASSSTIKGTKTTITGSSDDVNCDVVVGSGFTGQVQHVHVWSRELARSEILRELSWPHRVVSNGLVLRWNFDSSYLLLEGRAVNDLSMQGQAKKNLGVIRCTIQSNSSLPALVPNTSNIIIRRCLLRGEMPRIDATFPCGPVFANIWHFSAPEAFITELKNAYGGRLQFRLLAPSFNGSPRPRRGQVSIFGTNEDGEVIQISVSLGSFALPSASSWTYYSAVLREDFGWITEPDGLPLTSDGMQAVLAEASALWIRGDIWGYDASGPGQEVVYINDVILYAR